MQKSLVWKEFLSESKRGEGYRNLSLFKKLVFWVNYPFSYVRFYGLLYGIVLTDCVLEIREQDPLKQGLKRPLQLLCVYLPEIREQDPLKQGLKPR